MGGICKWVGLIMLFISAAEMIKLIILIYPHRRSDRNMNRRSNRSTVRSSNRNLNRNPVNANRNVTPVNVSIVPGIRATETGPMVYYANDRYGQRDKEYRFNYKKVEKSWRAYILKMPGLGNRDSSGVVTHRLYDNGRPYICWDSPVNSLKDMQTISKVWADNIQEYIATGKRFG